jgi:hypothetical protein
MSDWRRPRRSTYLPAQAASQRSSRPPRARRTIDYLDQVTVDYRDHSQLAQWLGAVDETKWISCPVGITAQERSNPPRTRAQEIPSGIDGMRVIVVDSDERRG